MNDAGWASWLIALAQLDAALEELRVLRRRVEELTAERDNWQARSSYTSNNK